jgi:hypothetical protein
MDRCIALSVGDMHKLGLGKDRIIYAGMPSEDVYSIVQVNGNSSIGDISGICTSTKAGTKQE